MFFNQYLTTGTMRIRYYHPGHMPNAIRQMMINHEYCMLHKYYFKKDEYEPYILCVYRFQGIAANNNRSHLVGHVVEQQWMNKACTSSEMLQEAGLIDSEFSKVVFIWFRDYLPHVPWRRVTVNLEDEQSDEEITID